MTTVDVRQFGATSDLLEAVAAPKTIAAPVSPVLSVTTTDEAFMTLLLSMSDTRKRIMILSLLSFLAMC